MSQHAGENDGGLLDCRVYDGVVKLLIDKEKETSEKGGKRTLGEGCGRKKNSKFPFFPYSES